MSIEAAQKSLAEEQRSDAIRQTIKWVVYSLLIVNWAYYIFDDWRAAQHTVVATDSLLGWMNSYATSLDELAWFGLLFLFEAETYWLSDDALTKGKRALFILLRVSCYGFLAHTIYAYVFDYFELLNVVTLPLTTTLCDLAGQDYAFLRNLEYSVVQSNNCAILATTGHLFQIGDALVISDAAGVSEATFLAAIDLEDAIVWLAVVIIIELVVLKRHLQECAHDIPELRDSRTVWPPDLQCGVLGMERSLGLRVGRGVMDRWFRSDRDEPFRMARRD